MLRSNLVQTKSNALFYLWPCLVMAQNHKQPNLTFQTDFFHAVNHWVVLPKNGSEHHYLYGYLYFDPAKGIVFYLENTLAFDGTWKLNRDKKSYVLQKTMRDPEMKVALLPKSIQQLWNLPEKPAALGAIPKKNTADYAAALGRYFNQLEQSSLAVPLLKKALRKNPNHSNLLFELGFAYNAKARYKKAIRVLELLVQDSPSQKAWEELGYAYLQTQTIAAAENCYMQALHYCKSTEEIQKIGSEMHRVFLKFGASDYANKWEAIAKNGEIPEKPNAENDPRILLIKR